MIRIYVYHMKSIVLQCKDTRKKLNNIHMYNILLSQDRSMYCNSATILHCTNGQMSLF